MTLRAGWRICLCQRPLSRTRAPMRVAVALALMILAMLAASSTQTTIARSELLLPIEIRAL